jgi:hypothetical protein
MSSRLPALELRLDSLRDRSSFFSGGEIPRIDVTGARVVPSGVWTFVVVDLCDQKALLDRLGAVRRFLVLLSGTLGPVAIPAVLLRDDPDDVAADIKRWALGHPLEDRMT